MKDRARALNEIVLLYNTLHERFMADMFVETLKYNRHKATISEVFKLDNGLEYITITIDQGGLK